MSTLKLSLSGVNYLNIGLMVISMALAINLPFELFLFAYAVLGPLHYMTEIGWLHQRSYFSLDKRDFIIPVLMCSLITLSLLLGLAGSWSVTASLMADLKANAVTGAILQGLSDYSTGFIFLAFTSAFFMVLVKNRRLRYALIVAMILPAYLLSEVESYETWIAVFLPTIIHVCLFTALFILFGAMKSKSFSGYLSFAVYILCALLIFQVSYNPVEYKIGENVLRNFLGSGFSTLNHSMWDILHPVREKEFFLNTRFALKIQAFIAFSYTYHYLNWFSKTEIIKWHQVPKPWLVLTVLVWIGSVLLYRYDYKAGLMALFFLSMLHVFLEFPLNVQSIVGIGKEGSKWFAKKPKPAVQKANVKNAK